MDFAFIYSQLNTAQKQAVDTIDGPVLVIAGPGTGKTQLLSARVANILKKTDTLPSNILCLTYSEAGARNMQARLASMIGPDAYKIAVHTFHGFSSSVIDRYPDYFYNGARLAAADPLTQHQTMAAALETLPHTNYFSARFDGEFTMQQRASSALSDIKQAGLTSDELRVIADHNLAWINSLGTTIDEIFGARISAATFENVSAMRQTLMPQDNPLPLIPSLSSVFRAQVSAALDEAASGSKLSTKPLTALKKAWCESVGGVQQLKAKSQSEKLRDMADVYDAYTEHLTSAKLYDFDDMIVRVVHTLETSDDLRAELQEQYLYVLVDEYQDTNLAQARLLHAWANTPINEGSPNLMAVGDDDQAIYSFQGADISNMLDFEQTYPLLTRIVLTDNYRSPQAILDTARAIVIQGEDRLESRDTTLNKQLASQRNNTAVIEQHVFGSPLSEKSWIAEKIHELTSTGASAREIAVIARGHDTLRAIAAQCASAGIVTDYERRDNIFEQPVTELIIQIARLICLIQDGAYSLADASLPKLFAHPAWHVPMNQLWQLSLVLRDTSWIESLQQQSATPTEQLALITDGKLETYVNWLITLAQAAEHTPMEVMIDYITGICTYEGHDRSPLYDYFFNPKKLESSPSTYLETIRNLRTLRDAIRQYQQTGSLYLADFVRFADECAKTGTIITSNFTPSEDHGAVQLITAHGSKGREFDHVIIVDATHATWSKAKAGDFSLSYPPNTAELARGGNSEDDRLRLFYVALTRAKQSLILTRSQSDNKGIETLPVAWLSQLDITTAKHDPVVSVESAVASELADWNGQFNETLHAPSSADLLRPALERFKLSASALDTFLDLEHAGPQVFFERYIIGFPESQNVNMAFGTAIHHTLQIAHREVSGGKTPSIEQLLDVFDEELTRAKLDETNDTYWRSRGRDVLEQWLKAKLSTFSAKQIAERSLGGTIMVGPARVTGRIDVMEPTGPTSMLVTDYKTGRPESTWSLDQPNNSKLYTYKRQLTFYKLLVEATRFQGKPYRVDTGVVSFIQPAKQTNEIVELTASLTNDDSERLQALIAAVWQRIMTLDMPNISNFTPDFKGIKAFEEYLLTN